MPDTTKEAATSESASDSTPVKPTFYLVGGAVRDQLLGLPVKDRDWVVVGATPEWMLSQGFKPVGADFPVFIHPETGEEYALARTERKTGRGYQGFTFFCAPNVTLAEDLQRRDLTINGLAQTRDGELIDEVGGHADLQAKQLRHVSAAFVEDPLRVLRVARFYARYASMGFAIAPETLELMREITQSGELEALTQERVFQELLKALETEAPHCFFEALTKINALIILMPTLANHFADADAQALSFSALANAVSKNETIEVRFACLAQGLAESNALEVFCQSLKAPKDFLDLARVTHQLIAFDAQNTPMLDKYKEMGNDTNPTTNLTNNLATNILKLLERIDAFRRPERFHAALKALNYHLTAQQSSITSNNPSPRSNPTKLLQTAHAKTKLITGKSVIQSAKAKNETPPSGQAMGAAIANERILAIQTILQNQHQCTDP